MRLLMVGMNHRTAPIELREQVAVGPERLAEALGSVVARYAHAEAALLSTCNRTELYVARPIHGSPTAEELRWLFAELGPLDQAQIDDHVIVREQDDAAAHLIGVAAGLDSLALGEPHILGQVRRAYETADQAETVGYVLHTVFQQALSGARRVRRDWAALLDSTTSIATLAIDFARQVFETFEDKTVLGVGAGEIGKMTMRTLMRHRPGRTYVINRTPGRAEALARELGLDLGRGGPRPWDQLAESLIETDVLITATGARRPIFTAKGFKPLVKKRKNRPLFIFDAALPRDVAAEVGSLRNVFLYNLDDLESAAMNTPRSGDSVERDGPAATPSVPTQRQAQFDRAWSQVRGIATATMSQIQHRDVGQLIRELRTRLRSMGQAEQDRTQRKIEALDDPTDPHAIGEALDEHTHRLINKILHMPLNRLDQSDPEAPLGFYAAALRELFELEGEDQSQPQGEPEQKAKDSQEDHATAPCPNPQARAKSGGEQNAASANRAQGPSRVVGLALALSMVLGNCACSLQQVPRWEPVADPTAQVSSVRVTEQSGEGSAVQATVILNNPNDLGLPLEDASYRLAVGDRHVRFRAHPPYALPPNARQPITLHAAIPTAGENLRGQPYRLTGWAIYEAPGELRKVVQDLGIPKPSVSFDDKGKLQ